MASFDAGPSERSEDALDPTANTTIKPKSRVELDGSTSEQRLIELVELDEEEDALDCKLTYNFANNEDVVKCAKVLVSMANTGGGYIVLGVAEQDPRSARRFHPIGIPDKDLAHIEITNLNNKLSRFVDDDLSLRIAIHRPAKFRGVPLALLFVPGSASLPLPFKIDGQYKGQKRAEFGAGEVWVRRGSACTRPNAADWRRIKSLIRRAEREKWAEDVLMVTPLIQRLDRITLLLERLLDATPTVPPLALTGTDHDTRSRVGDTAASRAADRLAPADYFLNTRQLCDRLQFWLNQPDLDEIQAFLKGAPAEFERVTTELEGATAEVLQSAKDLRLRPILNAIVIAALRATQAGRDEIAETASSSFFKIYERARTLRFPESTGVELDAIWVWLEIMRRVYVLGAYMIASSKLIRVSTLANQSPTFDPNWRGFLWARHALTETGRANRLTSKGLVGEALNELSRETNLLGLLSLDTEVLTDALCQYDLLQCIFAAQEASAQQHLSQLRLVLQESS